MIHHTAFCAAAYSTIPRTPRVRFTVHTIPPLFDLAMDIFKIIIFRHCIPFFVRLTGAETCPLKSHRRGLSVGVMYPLLGWGNCNLYTRSRSQCPLLGQARCPHLCHHLRSRMMFYNTEWVPVDPDAGCANFIVFKYHEHSYLRRYMRLCGKTP